eukprot:TRINITY_DN18950_c0_g1_i1.p1 TRINITY_DN18950_c0_g1~~TRINITY_DN18950_c0_g1_i1.p1  ORF type:complete len:240 (+),score=17.01 TRINITY_DN18950_c0_g1_i1:110-829(+)
MSPPVEGARPGSVTGENSVAAHSLLGLSHIKRAPKWSFNGRHGSGSASDGPGPGAYLTTQPDTTSRFKKSPNHAFGVSGRETLDKNRVPGPGAYTDKRGIGSAGKAFSLTPRRNTRARDAGEFPGPGAHDLRSSIGGGPKFSASPRRNVDRSEHVPGPGEYDQADVAVVEKPPRWGFGTSQRPDTANSAHSATPGPGAYLMGSAVGEGPKFSMQARRRGPRIQPSPGPGAHGGQYTTFA